MEDTAEVELLAAVHPRKISVTEGLLHPQVLQVAGEIEAGGHLELRKQGVDLYPAQLAEPARQLPGREVFLERGQPIHLARQQHDHGDLLSLVGHLQSLDLFVLEEAEVALLEHHRGLPALAGGQLEGQLMGSLNVELGGPVALEVDRIGQDHAGHGIDGTIRQQILDLPPGLSLYPAIDDPTGLIRGAVVQRPAGRAVLLLDLPEVALAEGIFILRPQGVGDGHFHAALAAGRPQAPLQLSEGGVQSLPTEETTLLAGFQGKLQGLGHLARRFTPRSAPGHRHGGGDAVGREEQVARPVIQLLVELEREAGIVRREIFKIGSGASACKQGKDREGSQGLLYAVEMPEIHGSFIPFKGHQVTEP